MPKKIDPDVRREQIADAVIDEIAAHGFRSVTLARIAERTGFAIGSIRHYFGDNFREVMRFTLGVLMQRIEKRAPSRSVDPAIRVVDAITFGVPTTERERQENIAFVEYRVLGRTDAELAADIAATSLAGMQAIRLLLQDALSDRVIDEQALQREALLLFTLTEGLSFSSAMLPEPLGKHDVRFVVETAMHRMRNAYPREHPTEAGPAELPSL